ncbi:MAG: hypothetical protein WCG21_11905 [Eubacteriales bacterium]
MAISQAELMTALQTLLSTVKFRLRGRRGTAAQLDPSLMKAGEFAFVTDTRTLYACYVDGVIEQVSHGFIPKATYGTLAALQAAHPTGVASDYYMVGTGPYHLYNWGGAAWVDMGIWNDMSLYATAASLANLAGTGRTTETVKGNTDAIVADVANLASGWIPVVETFAFTSATTITVASGATSRYQKGDKLRLTQHGAVKYFYIVAVTSTLLTVVGNGAVVIENTGTYPITAISYSRTENPFGFPAYFVWTPVITAGVGVPTTVTGAIYFKIAGGIVHLTGTVTVTNKGTASSIVFASIPVTPTQASTGGAQETAGTGKGGTSSIGPGGSAISLAMYDFTTFWVSGYSLQFSLSYFI